MENLYTVNKYDKRLLQQWMENKSKLMPWFQYGFQEKIEQWALSIPLN